MPKFAVNHGKKLATTTAAPPTMINDVPIAEVRVVLPFRVLPAEADLKNGHTASL
jgi:hypothetical protein